MKGDQIQYRDGYKYQLAKTYRIYVGIKCNPCKTDYITLTADGWMIVKKGYAWDGASGPTLDTNDTMRGSLVHDALYQLMRLGLLPELCRSKADQLLYDICVEDGMCEFRANYWKEAVKDFAASAAKAGTERPILIAP